MHPSRSALRAFLLSQEDFLRYGNHALTYRIVDRIFSQARSLACLAYQASWQAQNTHQLKRF